MRFIPEDLLSALLETAPRPTVHAPRDARGLYGLVDHHGDLRYIGSTSSTDQTFYERIHQRHRTGSEGMSHYFSQMYNTGRMWREWKDATTKVDGDLAKKLRNEFVVDHCRAVWLALPDTADIARLEAEVLAIAPEHAIAWNRRRMQTYDEPANLVDATLRRLGWGAQELAAIERQRQRFLGVAASPVPAIARQPAPVPQVRVTPFPKGPFRFFALDVETANNDRGSICQIGVACVRPDNSIETWMSYVDPQVDRWVFTYLHGISARTVKGAPTFAEVLPVLQDALVGHPELMTFQQAFQRRRGAETRLVTGTVAPQPDPVLQQNLARAHRWANRLRKGESLSSIARAENCSDSLVRSCVALAFLAPDLQRAILDGTAPSHLTTNLIVHTTLPHDWQEQAKALGL